MYPTVRVSGMCWYVQLNHVYLLSTTQVLLLGVGCKTSYDMVSIESSSLVYLPYTPTSCTLIFNHTGPFVINPIFFCPLTLKFPACVPITAPLSICLCIYPSRSNFPYLVFPRESKCSITFVCKIYLMCVCVCVHVYLSVCLSSVCLQTFITTYVEA